MKTMLTPALLALACAAPFALAQTASHTAALISTDVDEVDPAFGIPATDFWLTVLHNNDGEGKVLPVSSGPGAGFGGAARFKTLVDALKAEALTYPALPGDKGSVMISSGDNILPGITLEASIASGTYYDSILFDLIGYSMGGIVTRHYLQARNGDTRTRRYISLSAPQNGTLTAYLRSLK
jgi:2',3'-cyclic-nucleotide 2'-phosphodiesterase (5'-nucleotidase family)